MTKGTLTVIVVSAKGLKNADDVGKSDPYVRLWVDDVDSQRTTTKVEGKDDKLASGSIDLKNVFEKGSEEKTHELTHNLGFSKDGVITFKLTFAPSA
ncbi:3798_t:CDS:2 [Rhizophagus irregularis]|nr:3798_t:CDS:2 [Rhizophagus irregularis]